MFCSVCPCHRCSRVEIKYNYIVPLYSLLYLYQINPPLCEYIRDVSLHKISKCLDFCLRWPRVDNNVRIFRHDISIHNLNATNTQFSFYIHVILCSNLPSSNLKAQSLFGFHAFSQIKCICTFFDEHFKHSYSENSSIIVEDEREKNMGKYWALYFSSKSSNSVFLVFSAFNHIHHCLCKLIS